MPKRLIFIESHSSSLLGLEANFKVLAACVSQDFIPIFTAHSRFHYSIINITVSFRFNNSSLKLLNVPLHGLNVKLSGKATQQYPTLKVGGICPRF